MLYTVVVTHEEEALYLHLREVCLTNAIDRDQQFVANLVYIIEEKVLFEHNNPMNRIRHDMFRCWGVNIIDAIEAFDNRHEAI
jgi:hypothetical protein